MVRRLSSWAAGLDRNVAVLWGRLVMNREEAVL
jgi:hypothetical protein